jgi:hypothetical protein
MSRYAGRRLAVAAVAVCLGVTVSGCDALGSKDDDKPAAPATSDPTTAAAAAVFDAQFTRDGTFQSHVVLPEAPDLDFVYTLYPTKSTPRTNEWYPRGGKYFSFTLQAYDLSQELRAPFETKRKVWLSHVTVGSATTTSAGGAAEAPYTLDVAAPRSTFDPEPLTSKHGMLITSPKGAFELRNQKIGTVADDTIGVTLTMTATVSIETSAGSGVYVDQQVVQQVPIAIFASDTKTVAQEIPVDSN